MTITAASEGNQSCLWFVYSVVERALRRGRVSSQTEVDYHERNVVQIQHEMTQDTQYSSSSFHWPQPSEVFLRIQASELRTESVVLLQMDGELMCIITPSSYDSPSDTPQTSHLTV